MSWSEQERVVNRRVHVLECDGPGCNHQKVAERDYESEVPVGWIALKVIDRSSYGMTPHTINGERGPWHFHKLACLLVWARVKANISLEEE